MRNETGAVCPMYRAEYASPLGRICLASDGEALTGLWFEGQKYFGSTLDADSQTAQLPVFRQAADWLDAYFAGRRPDFTPPLRLLGTAFQQAVWTSLLRIPYGETRSYGQLAQLLHSAPRAVGSAVGRNPISLIVPCHRVLGAGGALTGYAGGLERKAALLALEAGNSLL